MTPIRRRTLTIGDRARPFDQLTAGHLRTWLHVRRERWTATAKPHLLINQSTAGGTRPVTRSYVQASLRRAGTTAQDLRADRLLAEAHAGGGDPIQLTRLFGISDPTAIRYCAELEQITAAGARTRGDSASPASRHDPARRPDEKVSA